MKIELVMVGEIRAAVFNLRKHASVELGTWVKDVSSGCVQKADRKLFS
jgi:hypothetical protein